MVRPSRAEDAQEEAQEFAAVFGCGMFDFHGGSPGVQ
jgi:hypothetical protein